MSPLPTQDIPLLRRPGIFLSHSGCDREFARRLAQDLERAGARVWVDERDVRLGDSLLERIEAGIDSVDFVAAILSPDSVKSEWVRRELEIAITNEIAGGRPEVLPLLYRDCKVPAFLRGKLRADFRAPTDYPLGLRMILDRLNLNPTASGQTAPPELRAQIEAVRFYGSWQGETGRLRLRLQAANVLGHYDWKGGDMAGHLAGAVQGPMLRFTWWWDMSPEKGNGFLLLCEHGQRLTGGWYFDYEAVPLDNVADPDFQDGMNPWAFTRVRHEA